METSEFAGFVRRILRAYARRVADGDVEALADLVALAAKVDTAIGTAVTGLRACGYSWAEVAARLGISRQAAQQRWSTTATSTGFRQVLSGLSNATTTPLDGA